jgi:hypothetical protein
MQRLICISRISSLHLAWKASIVAVAFPPFVTTKYILLTPITTVSATCGRRKTGGKILVPQCSTAFSDYLVFPCRLVFTLLSLDQTCKSPHQLPVSRNLHLTVMSGCMMVSVLNMHLKSSDRWAWTILQVLNILLLKAHQSILQVIIARWTAMLATLQDSLRLVPARCGGWLFCESYVCVSKTDFKQNLMLAGPCIIIQFR